MLANPSFNGRQYPPPPSPSSSQFSRHRISLLSSPALHLHSKNPLLRSPRLSLFISSSSRRRRSYNQFSVRALTDTEGSQSTSEGAQTYSVKIPVGNRHVSWTSFVIVYFLLQLLFVYHNISGLVRIFLQRVYLTNHYQFVHMLKIITLQFCPKINPI